MEFEISVWASSHFASQNHTNNCYIRQDYHDAKIVYYLTNK